MSNARKLADLLDSAGDIKAAHLDNVTPTTSASDLTSGTLPAARIAAGSIVDAKLATGIDATKLTGTIASGRLSASNLGSGTIPAARLDTATTQSASNNSTKIATTAYADAQVATIVDSAPGTLNTLNELAAALGDDANFSTTTATNIAAKLPLAGGTMTGNIVMSDDTSIGISDSDERIEFDGAGDISVLGANFGIGTDDPSTYGNLVLYGSGSNKTLAIIEGTNSPSNNDTYGSLSFGGRTDGTITAKISGLAGDNTNGTDGQLALYTADNTAGSGNLTERMRIDSAGNVGIGTTNPSENIHVHSDTVADHTRVHITKSTNAGTAGVSINSYTPTSQWTIFQEDASAGKLFFYDGADYNVTMQTDGKVGIGTTSPDYQLDVENTSGHAVMRLHAAANSSASLRLQNDAQDWDLNCQTNDTFALFDHTRNAQPLSVLPNGNVGIGVTDPDNPLEVFGADSGIKISSITSNRPHLRFDCGGNETLRLSANGNYGAIGDGSNNNRYMVFRDGEVGIGTENPAVKFNVSGSGYCIRATTSHGYMGFGAQNSSYAHHTTDRSHFYWPVSCQASGGFSTYSDARLKENVTPVTNALDKVALMNGVTFTWDNSSVERGPAGKQFGVLGQNMLEVDSELPSLREDPLETQENIDNTDIDTQYYAMDYSRLTPFFIEATKELKTIVEAQAATITDLTTRLEALENA